MERLFKPKEHLGWHSRGYLPHLDAPGCAQAVTLRLADSLPRHVVKALVEEIDALPEEERIPAKVRRINVLLDAGHGSCLLRETRATALVQEAFLYGQGCRYDLLAWTVMPNHVHTLIRPFEGQLLSDIVATWKKRSAREINKVVDRRGRLWYREYFDRFQRDEEHCQRTVAYIESNPVKAGLCKETSDWRWSSTRFRDPNGSLDWNLIAATIGLPGSHSGEWRSLEASPL